MIHIYQQPIDVQTTQENWWFIFDDNKNIIIAPFQCSGYTSSPFTMIIADSKKELEHYIDDNNLIFKNKTRINYSVDEL